MLLAQEPSPGAALWDGDSSQNSLGPVVTWLADVGSRAVVPEAHAGCSGLTAALVQVPALSVP